MSLLQRAARVLDKALGFAPPASSAQQLEAKSISAGEALPRAVDGRAHQIVWNEADALAGGMESSVWVYVCIQILARAVASRAWSVYDANGDALAEHPLSLLLASPNPWWSTATLMEREAQHLLLTGNGIITKVRGLRDAPVELWAIKPSLIKPIRSRADFVSGYEFRVSGDVRRFPAEDVVHLQLANPDDPYWGLAPYRAGRVAIDEDSSARAWNRSNLRNGARPSGLLSFAQPLSREQWQEARWRLRQHHMGAANAGVPFVSGSDAKWSSFDRTPLEMDFVDGRKLTREEICAVFGVPPVLAGILDKATYSNYETAEEVLWGQTVVPLLTMIAGQLTLSLGPDFGLRPGEHVWYDEAGIPGAKRLNESTSNVAKALFSMGVPVSLISERLEMELPRFPGDDVSYLPTGVVPASSLWVDVNVPSPGSPAHPETRSAYDPTLSPEENAARILSLFGGDL